MNLKTLDGPVVDNELYEPDPHRLVSAATRAAKAMGFDLPEPGIVDAYLKRTVLGPGDDGHTPILECLRLRLITEIEARNLLMAYLATWISHESGKPEPGAEHWVSPGLEKEFDLALFGREARRHASEK